MVWRFYAIDVDVVPVSVVCSMVCSYYLYSLVRFPAAAHVRSQERVLDHEPAGALQHHGTVVRRQDVVDERREELAEGHRRLVHVDAARAVENVVRDDAPHGAAATT